MKDFLDALPPHKMSLTLTHNEHRTVYQSVADYTEECRDEFVSPEEYQRAVETDEIWELTWYPETPVGSHRVLASTLEALLDAVKR